MKNRLILLSITSVLIFGLSACQSSSQVKKPSASNEATKIDAKQNTTQEKNDRPKQSHQDTHGASADDRIAFIEDYDGNDDQKLSKQEFDNARETRFNGMDANHDGKVSEQEYVDEYATRLEKKISEERKAQVNQTIIRFGAVDKNSDKKITPQEFHASGVILFNYLDAKKSGVINLKTPEPESDDNFDRSTLQMPSTHSVKGFLEIYDRNGSNEVTRADFEAQRKEKFDLTDTNHDGWLSSDEYLLEFENRLDFQAKQVRTSQIKQAHVRFNALDTDKNQALVLQEFSASGDRIFNGWDVNHDGWVTTDEPLPEPKQRGKKPEEKPQPEKPKTATAY